MVNQRQAYAYGVATVLCWSTVATAFKLALGSLTVFQLIFYATLASALVLLAALYLQGRLIELLPTFRSHWRITLIAAGDLSP